MKHSAAFILALVMVAASIAQAQPAAAKAISDGPHAASALAPIDRYDGRQLYSGLVFGQGPVGALFPELSALRQLSAENQASIAAVMSEIQTIDATFYARFAASIHSGDRVAIRAALIEATDVGNVAASRLGLDEHSGRSVADQDIGGVLVVFVAVIIVIIAFWGARTDQNALDYDIAANRIADVFSALR